MLGRRGDSYYMKIEISESEEQSLNLTDRLGLAWCRLNCWEWDDILGPKPPNFDDLPDYARKDGLPLLGKKIDSKHDIIAPAVKKIIDIIGIANTSRCWWRFVLKKSEREWLRWYLNDGVLSREEFRECINE